MKTKHLETNDFRPGTVYKIPDAPHCVLWDITTLCNQRCEFCYNAAEAFTARQVPTDTTSRILHVLVNWGVKEIIYLGGEPLLHPSLPQLLQIGHSHKLCQRIITNGRALDMTMAPTFSDNDVEVGISLHGTIPKIHDKLTRTQGSYAKALDAIGNLHSADCRWYVQFTPTRFSNTLLQSATRLKKLFPRLRLIDINRLLPHGIGAESADTLFLSKQEWWQCLKEIPVVKQMGIDVSIESFPHCWIRNRAKEENLSDEMIEQILGSIRPCFMGINQIALTQKGEFKLCPGGSAFSKSILEVNPHFLWRHHPVLIARRQFTFLPKQCVSFGSQRACKFFYRCCGGCKMANRLSSAQIPIADPLIDSHLNTSPCNLP